MAGIKRILETLFLTDFNAQAILCEETKIYVQFLPNSSRWFSKADVTTNNELKCAGGEQEMMRRLKAFEELERYYLIHFPGK